MMTMHSEPNAMAAVLPEVEERLRSWSSGLFTAWCDAVVTPWNLVPQPTTHEVSRGDRLTIPEALESGTLSLFA
ncbi:hypothetical protein SAMN03159338_1412 [Sphingomonas sp. NFR04]|uniref:hypothetical protein n=1 Tax=Sphingomonas sp. NFR04 TaxID=1566283 RepID=UPI0008F307E7|nr:hypothetical protein [Sphingomonas sp. NFR04]SFJ32778.1 hypothetical protein SAMN03159338_1412 [Sphingomonas sp. NFR04]